ncbi:MAG: hypothetical protein QGG26_14385 [Candidatus Undinarchaeales archaeon]|nr:hypothetical protein [Candidatus Undinarchaeales archaeon]
MRALDHDYWHHNDVDGARSLHASPEARTENAFPLPNPDDGW